MSQPLPYTQASTTPNAGGRLLDLSVPKVMGILNITPDSFYDGGQYNTVDAALVQAEKLLDAGGQISWTSALIPHVREQPK